MMQGYKIGRKSWMDDNEGTLRSRHDVCERDQAATFSDSDSIMIPSL